MYLHAIRIGERLHGGVPIMLQFCSMEPGLSCYCLVVAPGLVAGLWLVCCRRQVFSAVKGTQESQQFGHKLRSISCRET